jgi:protein-tyrosine-phosphatase
MTKILFLCSANVWRSQMAEGYCNYFTNSSIWTSAALIEDRMEKYAFSPAKEIINAMKQDWIDISHQKIKLLNREMCELADKIILLFDPVDKVSEFEIEWKNAVDFLIENYFSKLIISPVQDPFWEWIDKIIAIREWIKEIVGEF